MPESVTGVLPVVLNDAKVHLVTYKPIGRSYWIQSRLYFWNILNQLV